VKKLLLLVCIASLGFAGISDDIEKGEVLPTEIQEINKFIDNLKSECEKINYYTIGYNERNGLSLKQLENFYESASITKLEVEKINQQYKKRIVKFYNSYDMESFRIQKIYDKLSPVNDHWQDYNNLRNKLDISELCPEIKNLDEYKTSIRDTYKEIKSFQDKAENETSKKAEYEKKITRLKDIIKSMFSETGSRGSYSLAEYDIFLKTAREKWNDIETLKDEDGSLLIDQVRFSDGISFRFRTYDEYIVRVEDEKKYKLDMMSRDKANQKNIPAYKKWKSVTVPKFQKNLKAGDYVIGGIIWKVDGDLVVVDTGTKGLVSKRRNQTFPRVPQDLMPLYLNEIYGVAKY
jgi:hypothetical protein